MIIWNSFTKQVDAHPSRLALIVEDKPWDYRSLSDEALALAKALLAQGVVAGDRVALMMENSELLVCAYLACFRLGVVAVPVNTRSLEDEIRYVLTASGARTLILDERFFPEVRSLANNRSILDHCYIAGRGDWAERDYYRWLKASPEPKTWPELPAAQAAALIIFTSGTTARPKGVTHSQYSLAKGVDALRAMIPVSESPRSLISMRLCHIAAVSLQLLPQLVTGGTCVIMKDRRPPVFLSSLERHACTDACLLPADLIDILEDPMARSTYWGSLKCLLSGGDQVPLIAHHAFHNLTGRDVTELCGMTEILTWASNPPFGDKRPGSIGQPMQGVEVRVVDAGGREVAPGEVGEFLVRTECLMLGYWEQPGETAEVVSDGWMRTGDLGRCDDGGWLWFLGRAKHLIVHGGSNVSPLEVEEAINEHPAVEMCCVTGLPDARLGQRVAALVVLHAKDRGTLSEPELQHYVSRRIAAYKVPEYITFMESLPRNATGKLDRKVMSGLARNVFTGMKARQLSP